MRYRDLNNNTFTEEEKQLFNSWKERMNNHPIGKRVIKNLELESNVDEEVWRKFFKNLTQRMKSGDNDFNSLNNSITKDMLLMGSMVDKKDIPDHLSRLVKVRSLFKYLNNNLTIFRDGKTYGQIFNWIKNRVITVEKSFKKIKIRGKQPIGWSVFNEDVDYHVEISDIDELCDNFGLSDFNENDYVVELLYEKNKIDNPRKPTIIEAGLNPIFCPAPGGETCGNRVHLKFCDQGLTEIVHEPIPLQDISLITCKGIKERDVAFFNEADDASKEFKMLHINHVISTLENMETVPLMEYIENRLKGANIIPPLCTRSDEPPEYLLEKIYERSQDESFKSRFRDAISRLLKKEQAEDTDRDYLAALLIFCEQYLISEAVGPVVDIIISEELRVKDSNYANLRHRALMALARMPQNRRITQLWIDAIEDERYTAAAFAALREKGLDKISRYLSRFIRMHRQKPGSIDMEIAILTLYENFCDQIKMVDFQLKKILNNESDTLKCHLDNILKNAGIMLPLNMAGETDTREVKESIIDSADQLRRTDEYPKDREFLKNIEFVFLYAEMQESQKAYQLLNKTLRLPVDLNRVLKLLPSESKDVRLHSLKSLLCYRLLSSRGFEPGQVLVDINAWMLVALVEDNLTRQAKWSEIVVQFEKGGRWIW